MKAWIKRLHIWSLKWTETKWGALALFLCAFADASFFGLPTPLIYLALALLNKSKAYRYALIGVSGTLLGSLAGYSIGHFAWISSTGEFTGVAQFLINNIPGFSETGYNNIKILFEKWDYWILFLAAALPIPYKIFSISSGVFDVNLFIFCTATLISQGIKFYILALLTVKLGTKVKKLFEINWKPIALIVTAGIALTFILIKIF